MNGWKWGASNILRLHSITQRAALDRGGIPVSGDEFTLNPGANGEEVTGGASWRMIVDFSDLGHSFGVYPGGESQSVIALAASKKEANGNPRLPPASAKKAAGRNPQIACGGLEPMNSAAARQNRIALAVRIPVTAIWTASAVVSRRPSSAAASV